MRRAIVALGYLTITSRRVPLTLARINFCGKDIYGWRQCVDDCSCYLVARSSDMSMSKKNNKIDVEERLTRLEGELERIHSELWLIRSAKVDNTANPYHVWLYSHCIEDKVRSDMEVILTGLSCRLEGEGPPAQFGPRSRQILKESGIFSASKRGARPSFEEFCECMARISGVKNPEQALQLLRALHEQGFVQPLCKVLLRDAKMKNTKRKAHRKASN